MVCLMVLKEMRWYVIWVLEIAFLIQISNSDARVTTAGGAAAVRHGFRPEHVT
jgi:hypothetical protein